MFALWIVASFALGIFLTSYAVARMLLAERRVHHHPPAGAAPAHPTPRAAA